MFATVCTNCDAILNAPDSVEGKKVKCKKCGDPFVARRAEDPEPVRAPKKSPPPRRRDDDDDDTPRKSTKTRPAREEDEPRPKSKGKRRPPPKKSPVLLFGLLGVAAAVVLVGGPLFYFLVLKDDSPKTTASTDGTGEGKATPKSVAANTVGWVDFTDPEGKYAIKFPTLPTSEDMPAVDANGVRRTIKAHQARGQAEIFVIASTPIDENAPDDQLLEAELEQFKLMLKGSSASDIRPITYQSRAGRQMILSMQGKKGSLVSRMIRAGNRMIVLTVAGDAVTADAPRVLAFFESLKIDP